MITPLVSSSSSYSKSGVLFSDNKSDIHDITEQYSELMMHGNDETDIITKT
jgi:hypothetical protein